MWCENVVNIIQIRQALLNINNLVDVSFKIENKLINNNKAVD